MPSPGDRGRSRPRTSRPRPRGAGSAAARARRTARGPTQALESCSRWPTPRPTGPTAKRRRSKQKRVDETRDRARISSVPSTHLAQERRQRVGLGGLRWKFVRNHKWLVGVAVVALAAPWSAPAWRSPQEARPQRLRAVGRDVRVVSSSSKGATKSVTANCPSGKQVIGGGVGRAWRPRCCARRSRSPTGRVGSPTHPGSRSASGRSRCGRSAPTSTGRDRRPRAGRRRRRAIRRATRRVGDVGSDVGESSGTRLRRRVGLRVRTSGVGDVGPDVGWDVGEHVGWDVG